jgi:hypothetical protein
MRRSCASVRRWRKSDTSFLKPTVSAFARLLAIVSWRWALVWTPVALRYRP